MAIKNINTDVNIIGNLTVEGTTTTINTTTVEVKDNILQLNTTPGSPDTATATTSGISIYRGDGVTQASLIFDDADDTWDLTNNLVVAGNVTGANLNISNWNTAYDWGDHAGAYLPISGGTLTGNLQIGSSSNKYIKFSTATTWYYYLGAINDDFYIYDAQGLNFFKAVYNGGGTGKYAAILDKLYVYNDGKVGIGTTSPAVRLHVFSSGIAQRLESSNSYTQLDFYNTTNTAANRNWAIGANLYNYGDFNIMASAAYNTAPNVSYTYLTIKNSGYVGIGTASPNFKLDVEHSGNASNGIQITNTDTGTGARSTLELVSDSSQLNIYATSAAYNGVTGWGDSGVISTSTSASGGLILNAQSTGISFQGGTSTKMFMSTGGNVGIGTTSPQTELHVKGNNGWGEVRIEGQSLAGGQGASVEFYSEGTPLADIYANTSKDLILRTNGTTERMRIDSSGNVGIGKIPAARKLEVQQVLGGNAAAFGLFEGSGSLTSVIGLEPSTNDFQVANIAGIRFYAGSTIGNIVTEPTNERMRITSSGNIGIGTTSPSTKLAINGGNGNQLSLNNSGERFTQMGLYYNGTQNGALWLDSTDATVDLYANTGHGIRLKTGGDNARLTITSSGDVGIGTTNPAYKLDVSGTIRASSYFTSDYYRDSRLEAMLYYAGSNQIRVGSGVPDDYLYLYAGASPRMSILANGNVGIGTTNPSRKLHLYGDGDQLIFIENTGTYHLYAGLSSSVGIIGSNNATPLSLQTNGASRVYIDTSGNVGIGTTTPGAKLSVVGVIRSTEQVDVSPSGGAFRFFDGSTFYGGLGIRGWSGVGATADMTMYLPSTQNNKFHISRDTTAFATFDSANSSFQVSSTIGAGDNVRYGIAHYDNTPMAAGVGGQIVLGYYYTSAFDKTEGAIIKMYKENGASGHYGSGLKFQVRNTGDNLSTKLTLNPSGTLTAVGDVIAYSDVRVKENVETIDNALDKVMALRGVSYNRTDGGDKTKKVGVIAQEIQKVLPEVVQEQEDGMLGVSYGNIVGVLIEAIKEQQKQIDELKALLNGGSK